MKYLAVDIGGSSIKYAILDENVNFIERGTTPTPLESIEQFTTTIASLYDKFDNISAMAISMPGIIDSQKGFAYTGGSLTYIKDMNIVDILQKHCNVPIVIGNDAKCAAYAEVGYGSLKDVNDAVVIILGTGIGGCLIKDRKVHNGKNFAAGEFSSIKTNCEKGYDLYQHWCFINGIIGLLKLVQHNLQTDVDYSGKEIFEMANSGNQKVIDAIDKFSENIAIQIYNLQAIYDPEKVAIGGGISSQPLLIELIDKHVDKITQAAQKMYFPIQKAVVVPCKFRNDANLLGAYYQLIESLK